MGIETEQTRNGYPTSLEMLDKLEDRKVRIAQQLSELFFSKLKNLQLRLHARETCGVC